MWVLHIFKKDFFFLKSLFCNLFIPVQHCRWLEPIPPIWGKRQELTLDRTLFCHRDTHSYTHSHSHWDSVDTAIHLKCTFWGCVETRVPGENRCRTCKLQTDVALTRNYYYYYFAYQCYNKTKLYKVLLQYVKTM